MQPRALLRFAVVLLLMAPEGFANPKRSKEESQLASIAPLLSEVESYYKRSQSLSAKFTQEGTSGALGTKKQSSGTFHWRFPNSLRWQTLKPDPSLLVSNGQTIWLYTPPFEESESGQVIVRKVSEVQTKLMDALLAGRFSSALKQGLKITSLPNREFLLKPRAKSKDALKVARVQLSEDKPPLISKVVLEFKDGNYSTITLSEIESAKPLADDLFFFKIPPNTDILKE